MELRNRQESRKYIFLIIFELLYTLHANKSKRFRLFRSIRNSLLLTIFNILMQIEIAFRI